MRLWLVRTWRRLRGLCPSCGGELEMVLFEFGAGDACKTCGWWRDDGDLTEHWPKVTRG